MLLKYQSVSQRFLYSYFFLAYLNQFIQHLEFSVNLKKISKSHLIKAMAHTFFCLTPWQPYLQ